VDNQYPLRNKIRKLLLRFQTKNDNLVETVKIPLNHFVESLPFVHQLRAQQNMNIGNVITRNLNLSNFNNKKGMLTATIEQECSASIKHRALLVLHTHNNSESLLDHFVKDLTERL